MGLANGRKFIDPVFLGLRRAIARQGYMHSVQSRKGKAIV